MSFEQEKMIVESLPSLYPLQKFEEEAINALVSLPIDDDAISRKAAIEAVEFGITYAKAINKETGEVTVLFEESNAELQEAADRIKQLPPAQPQMPSNTSNELKALNSINTTQFNALAKLADAYSGWDVPDTNVGEMITKQQVIDVLERVKRTASAILYDGPVLMSYNDVLDSLINIVNLMPEVQQIIHCKDCKYFKQVFAPNDNDGLCGHWHSKRDARTSRKGYCSHAERKQNDTERC